jgi:Ca2+-binding RTX toxin-like protein
MSSSITDYLYPSRQASYAEQQNRMVNATERLRDDSEASTERLRQSLFAVSGATGNDGLISGPAGSRIKNFLAMLEEYMAGASAGSETKTIQGDDGVTTSVFGGDGDDEIDGYDKLMASGGAGNDRITGYDELFALGGDGDDYISGYNNTQAAGDDGNDRIYGYDNLRAHGGRGNDYISGYDNLHADGGEGDDVIDGYDNVVVNGGAGNDRINAYDNARINAGSGNDEVYVYSNATISLGDGDDYVDAMGKNNRVDGGEGNDRIHAGVNAVVNGGTGDDYITADRYAIVDGGEGDDHIRAYTDATVRGGKGDDYILVNSNATVLYDAGDGLDIMDASPALQSSTVQFGPGVSADDLDIVQYGDHLMINVGDKGDGILVRNGAGGNLPTLSFSDGQSIDADGIAASARVADTPPGERLAKAIAYDDGGYRVNTDNLIKLKKVPLVDPK